MTDNVPSDDLPVLSYAQSTLRGAPARRVRPLLGALMALVSVVTALFGILMLLLFGLWMEGVIDHPWQGDFAIEMIIGVLVLSIMTVCAYTAVQAARSAEQHLRGHE